MREATPSIFSEASGYLPASVSPGGCSLPDEAESRELDGAGVPGGRAEPDSGKISIVDAYGSNSESTFTGIELSFTGLVKLGPRTTAWRVADIDDLIESFRPEGGRS